MLSPGAHQASLEGEAWSISARGTPGGQRQAGVTGSSSASAIIIKIPAPEPAHAILASAERRRQLSTLAVDQEVRLLHFFTAPPFSGTARTGDTCRVRHRRFDVPQSLAAHAAPVSSPPLMLIRQEQFVLPACPSEPCSLGEVIRLTPRAARTRCCQRVSRWGDVSRQSYLVFYGPPGTPWYRHPNCSAASRVPGGPPGGELITERPTVMPGG